MSSDPGPAADPGLAADPLGVALLTGAGGHLGRVLTHELVRAGWQVIGVTRDDADLADASAVAALVDRIESGTGRIDLLVNNAARQPVAPYLAIDAAAWDDVADANLRAAHLLTRAVAQRWVAAARPGAVVNIGSIEGRQPAAGHAHYAVSKAGLEMLTRAAALELGPHWIRVNLVAPGLIDDGEIVTRWPEGVARWHAAAPLPGLVAPEEVADAVCFLASPAARGITGATIVVDHGVLTHPTW